MKLFNEEKTGLKIGLSKYKLILLLFFLQEIIFPQIPFKGFCKLNSFGVEPGYKRLFSLNFDNNEYSDLLVYNPLYKMAQLFSGISGTNFQLKKEFNFPVEISNLEGITQQNKMIESYAFTSRKDRTCGTLKFQNDGNVTIINQLKFDYYPENISVSYNHNLNEYEFVISGNAFNGISIINEKSNKLFEKKITDKTIFKDARFIDFNSDGYEDIVAINSLQNKIHFFFRNSKNDFEDLRQIDFSDEITSLQVFDFNYDGYSDFIVSFIDGIVIYYGDATASYKNITKVKTNHPVDKFVFGDYNRDGFFDLNYLNIQNGTISTVFAKSFNSFYPELIHFKEVGLVDVITFYSKFVNGVAYLNVNGKTNILSKVNSLSEEQKLAIAIKPNHLTTFDFLNNGVIDLAYIDDENNSLNFILRDASGLPENLYTIELFEHHKKIKITHISEEKKYFYLFSDDKRSIEALEVDFKTFTFKRKFYYSEGLVQDVVIKSDYKNDLEIFILYSNNAKLGLQVQTKVDENYFTKLYPNLEKNWSNAHIVSEVSRTIGYLQTTKTNLIYKTVNANDRAYKIIFNTYLNNDDSVKSNSPDLIAEFSKDRFAGIFSKSKKAGLFVDGKVQFINDLDILSQLRITGKNHLFFGKNKSIFISNIANNSVYEFNLSEKTNWIKSSLLFKEININEFIIEKLEPRNDNFIFTNKKNGLIEIRQLH